MGILAGILIYGGIAVFCLVALFLIFIVGVVVGRAGNKPANGYTGFTTVIQKEVYNGLLDKGAYKTEQEMLQDALTLLNWGLDISMHGRIIGHCEPDGSDPVELPLPTFQAIRAAMNPRIHLERCFGLNSMGEENED